MKGFLSQWPTAEVKDYSAVESSSRIQEESWGLSGLQCCYCYCPFPYSLTDRQYVAIMHSSGVLNLSLITTEKNVSVEKTKASLFNDHLLTIFSLQKWQSNSFYNRNKDACSSRSIKRAKWKGEGAHGHFPAMLRAQNPLGLMGSYAAHWTLPSCSLRHLCINKPDHLILQIIVQSRYWRIFSPSYIKYQTEVLHLLLRAVYTDNTRHQWKMRRAEVWCLSLHETFNQLKAFCLNPECLSAFKWNIITYITEIHIYRCRLFKMK